jgi:Protein of unknown function (DUF3341)
MHAAESTAPFGLMAQFVDEQSLAAAIKKAKAAGYTKMDAYTPFPSEEVIHELEDKKSKVPLIVLLGGMAGAIGMFGFQYWASVIDYPLNVGGRPLNSWVSFIVPTFEVTILLASISGVVGMLALNGLPQPYHPVFNVPAFNRAAEDGFFLVLEAEDAKFDRRASEDFLRSSGADNVWEVAP